MKRARRNNKGFSLIELIVAVAILAVIVAPLLNTFVVSAKVAMKGRQARNTTLLAQNLVEISESQKIADLLKGDPYLGIAEDVAVYEKDATGYQEVTGEVPPNQEKYYIGLKGALSGRKKLDALLTFDAKHYDRVNQVETVNYSPMDSVYSQPKEEDRNPDKLAAIAFADKASIETGIAIDPAYFIGKMNRTIAIQLTKKPDAPGSETGIISASANFVYETKYGSFSMREESDQGDFYHGKYSKTEQGINSVYVFYYPNYGGTDKIIIDNRDDLKVDAFLIKQKTPDETELLKKEIAYKAELELRESAKGTGRTPNVTAHSNMSTNVVNGSHIAGPFSYKVYKGSLRYFNDTFSEQLVSKSQKNRLYSVTVDLFQEGKGFDDSARVLRLTGSKTN